MKKYNIAQSFINIVMAFIACIGMSSNAQAHVGHNHVAPEALLVHVLFYGSIIAAIAIAGWLAYRQFSQQKNK